MNGLIVTYRDRSTGSDVLIWPGGYQAIDYAANIDIYDVLVSSESASYFIVYYSRLEFNFPTRYKNFNYKINKFILGILFFEIVNVQSAIWPNFRRKSTGLQKY